MVRLMARQRLYKVVFTAQGKTVELYARRLASSSLWGFTEIADLVFAPPGEGRIVDPVEERLREEFRNTHVLHIPIHAIVRIEEVDRLGAMKVSDAPAGGGTVMPFPVAPPRGGG